MSANFNYEHMFTYLKGFTSAMNWTDAQNALLFARKAHEGQTRKSGQPYIVHPLTVACHAIALGIRNEIIIAGALLHDVPEDCHVEVDDLPVSNPKIKDVVRRLTHVKPTPLAVYYAEIAKSPEATIIKLLDRCDNVSTMAGVFSIEKTYDYIQETHEFVMPLYRKAKTDWPEYSDTLFVLKYHILSVVDGLQAVLDIHEDASCTAPIGVVIAQLATEKKTRLTSIAKQVGMKYGSLLDIASGRLKPTKADLAKLAESLGIKAEHLENAVTAGSTTEKD